MKKPIHPLKGIVLLTLIAVCLFNNPARAQQSLIQVNGWNAYVHLPADYSTTTKSYPTIIFFPGLGEIGTTASLVIENGPGAYLTQGWDGNVGIGNDSVEFIVISLQPAAAYPAVSFLNTQIQALKSLYRIDNSRLFLTGLSEGGWCCTMFISGDPIGGPYVYAPQIKAVVNVEGVIPSDNPQFPYSFQSAALNGVRLCSFEQVDDGRDMPAYTNEMDSTVPNSALLTETDFGDGGHCCWASFFGGQGTIPSTFTLDGISQNIYQWLARQALGMTTTIIPPVANAGSNQTIVSPNSSVTLTGSATDADGTIVSYNWAQVSGPVTSTIASATSATTAVTGLTSVGTYSFSLTVTDNNGAVNTDTMQVTVSAESVPPVANAGSNQSITLPINTLTLSGSSTDVDGTVVSYLWSQVSGPSTATISSASTAISTISNLIQGKYSFSLTVSDNNGATNTDTVSVIVNAAVVCNTNAPKIYTFTTNNATTDIYQLNLGAKGGDTIKIYSGNYTDVIEFDSLSGDPCNPITIINVGGQVSTATIRIKSGCQYVHITGTGDPNTAYGFKCLNGPLGMDYGNHIEYDHIEIIDTGGVGLFMKAIPDTTNPYTYYGHGGMSYITNKIHIHNNYIHNTGGEGMYIGPTNPDGGDNQAGSGTWPDGSQILPNRLDSIEIDHNILDSISWTGIQLSNARDGSSIHDNTLNHIGYKDVGDHQTGVILGGNTNGSIYNNHIQDVTGNGIETFGYGTINIYSNYVDSAGYDGTTEGQEILFTNDIPTVSQPGPPQQIVAYNNAFNHPMPKAAIRVAAYDNNSLPSNIYNNTFCIPGAATNWQGTYLILNVAGSSNVNNTLYCGPVTPNPVANAGADITITLPVNSITLNGSGTEANGLISSYKWTQASGPSSGTIANSTSASTTVTGLVAGVYKFVLTVADSSGLTATDTMQATVNAALPAPVITSGVAVSITVGVGYSYSITASNTPVSYGATGLPSGLSINTSTGVISGMPTTIGVSDVTISATNSGGTGTTTLIITIINAVPTAPVISGSTSISGTVSTSVSYTITASNSPTSYGATGLPTGLSINTSTGVISGTPTSSGTSNVAISAINAGGTGTKTLTITINPLAPVISSNSTATGTTGAAFSYTITASNTPASYSATGLPSGLSINTSTGVITGTPTASSTSSVAINATNAGGTGTKTLTITINPPAPVISSNGSASGTTGVAFSYTITASNTPTSYSATGLPSGLSINTSTGVISGTPTVSGTSNVTINAINASGTGTKTLTITINPPAPVISSNSTATGTTGTVFSYTITASNTPASYSATGLPAGLSINTSTGAISGIPTATGTFNVTINAINTGGTGSKNLAITINNPIPSVPVVSGNSTANGTTGSAFSYTITASNTPISYSATGLPSGLSVNTTTGLISGTPTINGIFDVTINATNAGGTGSKALTVTINPPPPIVSGSSTASGTTGIAFNYAITASNTPTSYGATGLPSGLSINSSTGVITGTPVISGSFSVTINATNAGGTGSGNLVITIGTLPSVNAGVAQSVTLPLNSVTLSGNATDINATIILYGWAKISGPASGTITNTSSASTSVTGLVAGIYKFALTATNNLGATGKDTVQVTVNTKPIANAGTDQTIVLPTNSVTLTGSSTDNGGTITSYQWIKISGPATGVITSATSASTTVTELVQGGYKFALTVTDNTGETSTDTVQVVVNPASVSATNLPPTANAGEDQTIVLPTNSVTLTGSGIDVDGTIASYEWSKAFGPASGTITSITAANTTVTGLVAGVYKFTLTVTDNKGATGKDTVQITVDTKPVANAGANQLITLPTNSVTLTGSGTDAGGTSVSYQWTKISGSAGIITSATAASTSVTGLTAGIYKFVLTVTDNNGSIGKDTVQVTVNVPPTAHAGADQIITLPVNSVTLDGSGTDIDGTIAAYQWAKISGPTTGTIISANSASTVVNSLVQGVYKFVLTVTDNDGATGKDTVQVIVNIAPIANAGTDQTITLPASSVTLSGSGVDVDGTVASYKWSEASGPSTAVITNVANAGTTVTKLVTGIYKFILTVTDNDGGIGSDSTFVTVINPASNIPTANAGADMTIQLPIDSVTLNGSGSDPKGKIIAYKWTKVSGPAGTTIVDATSFTTDVTGLSQGIYKFVLSVEDSSGTIGTDTVQVIVKAANIPPVANAGNDTTISLPATSVTLDGSGSTDADGTIVAYQWEKIAGPSKGSIGNATEAQVTITGLEEGVYEYELTVTDNDGAKTSDTVQVTVTANLSMEVFAGPVPVQTSITAQVTNIPPASTKLAVTLTSSNGETVYRSEVPVTLSSQIKSTQEMSIDMSNLRAGVYFLEITADNGSSVVKTIVKN